MDGIPDPSDPAPEDYSNYSQHNGRYWYGTEALGDLDRDGRLNFFDLYPEDFYDGNPPVYDLDQDGIPDNVDPDPGSYSNKSPLNGVDWGPDAFGDADGDGTANYWDSDPYPMDTDGDGLADSDDPAPIDPYNYSGTNFRFWPGASALGDLDNDGQSNFYDPEPEGGPPREPDLPQPSASASPLVILNDGYDELGAPPAEGVTPKRDLDERGLVINAGPRAGKMAINRLTELNLSLPADYVKAGGSVTFNQSGVGFIRLYSVRMVGGEGVEGREILMGVPYVPPNDGTWVHLIESVRGGGVTLTCHFPWMMYGQFNGEHPSGVMSSDIFDILNLVSVEVVVRKKTESAAPETGLLVKKGDVITFDVNGSAPAGEFPFPPESVKWKVRQLKHDGMTTGWADLQGQGAEVDFMTNQGGVFEAKAVVTPPGGKASDYPLTRKKDAPHSSDSKGAEQDIHKAGAVDYFGVADQQWQIDLREKALADLGSEKYKQNGVFVTPGFPRTTYDSPSDKCNAFVYHKCYEAGIEVPLTRGGKWLGLRTSPPLAIDWWNDNSLGKKDMSGNIITTIDIPNWSRLPDDAMPQPGFVVARPVLGARSDKYASHVGIFDYDGSWISAGPLKVNKYCHPKNYQPQGVRKYDK